MLGLEYYCICTSTTGFEIKIHRQVQIYKVNEFETCASQIYYSKKILLQAKRLFIYELILILIILSYHSYYLCVQ
jgi:hypothetical protein